jgi:hypothetical protein
LYCAVLPNSWPVAWMAAVVEFEKMLSIASMLTWSLNGFVPGAKAAAFVSTPIGLL